MCGWSQSLNTHVMALTCIDMLRPQHVNRPFVTHPVEVRGGHDPFHTTRSLDTPGVSPRSRKGHVREDFRCRKGDGLWEALLKGSNVATSLTVCITFLGFFVRNLFLEGKKLSLYGYISCQITALTRAR